MLKFLKLGGSLITDKNGVRVARHDVIKRVAREIAEGLADSPATRLMVGHGSGSYGHVIAQQHRTRQGVSGSEGWRGFAEVSLVAARLNALIAEELHDAGVPVVRFQPSAMALCNGGKLVNLGIEPIRRALDAGLVPLVYGDVAFDKEIGGTIISTEEIFTFAARELHPGSIWLAGEVPGVLDAQQRLVPSITPTDIEFVQSAIGASGGTDVTGGMASKVRIMLELCRDVPGLSVYIFNGLEESSIRRAVADGAVHGTRVYAV